MGWCFGGIFPDKVLGASLEPMPAKTDLLLAEAKPISNSSGASGIICLEREGNIVQLHMEEGKGVTICERSSSADTEVGEEGGAGGAPGT